MAALTKHDGIFQSDPLPFHHLPQLSTTLSSIQHSISKAITTSVELRVHGRKIDLLLHSIHDERRVASVQPQDRSPSSFHHYSVRMITNLIDSMKASNAGSEERNMQLHLVIPPPTDHKKDARSFTCADMTVLGNSIDGLSIMTYDFSGPNRLGPNAPAP